MPRLIFALLLVLAAACGSRAPEQGSPPVTDPDTPISGDPGLPSPPGKPQAQRVEPQPGAVDVRPHPFEEVEAVGDRTLAVRFWDGVAPCHVLDRVEVVEADTPVVVTLYTGRDAEAGNVACIEVAVLKEVRVELDTPLEGRAVVDGAKSQRQRS